MPRKRRPFVVNGATVELDAPGLKIVRNEPYWLPPKRAAARGYLPRTVRLHYPALTFSLIADAIMIVGPPADFAALARHCGILQAEMLEWLVDPEGCEKPVPRRMLMCARHWRMVPRALQDDVWAEYVPGQEQRLDPTTDYLDAAHAAIEAVATKEGRRDGGE